jgi:hypothetical protein
MKKTQIKSKSHFKTFNPIKEVPPSSVHFLETIKKIALGELDEGIIAQLPDNRGDLYIDHFKTSNIVQKHGEIPLENMIITATEPTLVIVGVIKEMSCMTLVYEFNERGFVLSARKFNGHYVVTFFEPSDGNYIESIKKRGEILFDKKKTP